MIESLKLARSILVSRFDVYWAAAVEFVVAAPAPCKLIPLRSLALLLEMVPPPLFELIILKFIN
jgi:hypothetical protein